MAHECPICGSVCFCQGDIDDLCLNDNDACEHWRECDSEEDDDWYDDGDSHT